MNDADTFRIWRIARDAKGDDPADTVAVHARFRSFSHGSGQVFLGLPDEETKSLMCRRLSQEDRDYLNRLFADVGYVLGQAEPPCLPPTPSQGFIGVFGNDLVNMLTADGATFRTGEPDDACVMQLRHMPRLDYVRFLGCRIATDETIAKLPVIPRVKKAYFTLSNVTDAGMAALSRLKQLEFLRMEEAHAVSDAGFTKIAELPSLKTLSLCRCRGMSEQGWSFLERMTSLEQLHLFQFFVTDQTLMYLRECRRLRVLFLQWAGESAVTDTGLSHIGKLLPQLEELTLWGGKNITDAGLAHLCELRQLKKLDVRHCPAITPAGIQMLKKHLPHVEMKTSRVYP